MTLEAPPTARAAVTALSILQTDIDGLLTRTDPLAGARTKAPALRGPTWALTLSQVGQAAAGFVGIDVGDLMLAGWRKSNELIDAGRRTRDTDVPFPVDLAGRDVVLRQHPWVEVTWQRQTLAEVHFEVTVEVRVVAAEAVVRRGSLVELSSGRVIVGVSLSTHGETLGPRERELDPRLVIDLGDGIRLVD